MTCLTHIRHLIDVCRIELQYFGHLMQTADSMEKNLMLGRIAGRRRRARQKMRLLDGITNLMDMILSKLQETVKDREEQFTRKAHRIQHIVILMAVNRKNESIQNKIRKGKRHSGQNPEETRSKLPRFLSL